MTAHPGPALRDLLKRTSRSFYLSIQVLPAAVRAQVAIGYLIARAADSMADTTLLPAASRCQRLLRLQKALASDGPDEDLADLSGPALPETAGDAARAERLLLGRIPECLALLRRFAEDDQRLLRRVLSQLIDGMLRDLSRFPNPTEGSGPVPPAEVVALPTLLDLDEYTYFAAGCVGEFWTDLTAAHLPQVAHLREEELRGRGVDLGKALQLVNVIRDAPADLLAGRCYWPQELLGAHGLLPADLAALCREGAPPPSPELAGAVQAVTDRLLVLARQRVERAWPYVEAIPPRALRLRLSCVWPLWLCLDTLSAIARAGSPILVYRNPVHERSQGSIKVRRQEVYSLLFTSTLAGVLDMARPEGNRLLHQHHRHLAGVV
jgi:farnesyl-diphosphate farnesyltransferase